MNRLTKTAVIVLIASTAIWAAEKPGTAPKSKANYFSRADQEALWKNRLEMTFQKKPLKDGTQRSVSQSPKPDWNNIEVHLVGPDERLEKVMVRFPWSFDIGTGGYNFDSVNEKSYLASDLLLRSSGMEDDVFFALMNGAIKGYREHPDEDETFIAELSRHGRIAQMMISKSRMRGDIVVCFVSVLPAVDTPAYNAQIKRLE